MKCVCNSGMNSLYQNRQCRGMLQKAVAVLLDVAGKQYDPANITKAIKDGDLHVIYDIKNTSYENRDKRTIDYEDGTQDIIGGGGLNFSFITKGASLDFISNFLAVECANPNLIFVLADGSLLGYGDVLTPNTTTLSSIPVSVWVVNKYNPTNTDTEVAHAEVTVQIDEFAGLENWIYATSSENNFDLTANVEPKDVLLKSGAVGATSTTVEVLGYSHSLLGNTVKVEGLVLAEFEVKNGTTPVPVTVAESPAGTYTLTYSTQTGGTLLTIKVIPGAGAVTYRGSKTVTI